MVVEVLSNGRCGDYLAKRRWYAMSRIPQHLLVDIADGVCELHSHPLGAAYRTVETHRFGERVKLSEPFGFAVDTAGLRWAGPPDGSPAPPVRRSAAPPPPAPRSAPR